MLKKLLARLRKDERGLTLVELLAVIVILAIVGGIATVSIGGVIENSKKDAHVANALQLISAAKLYEATGGEKDLTADAGVLATELQTAELIDDLLDPWTKNKYTAIADAKVTKDADSGEYSVTLTADNTKCSISHTEQKLLQEGRKVCDVAAGGGGEG